jgi:hypothetical protein
MLHGDLFTGDARIGRVRIWLPVVVMAIQWNLSYFIHQRLRTREIFYRFFRGKRRHEIKDTYQSFAHESSESLQGVRSIRKLVIALQTITFVIYAVLGWGFRSPLTAADRLMVLIFYAFSFIALAALNGMHEVQFILMDGYVVPRRQRRFRLAVVLLFFVVIAAIAAPLTGREPLLPSSYLAAVFEWLQGLGSRADRPERVESPELRLTRPDSRMPDVGRALGEIEGGVDLSWLTKIIGWALLGALVLGAAVFLFSPFLRVSGGKLRPRERIAALFAAIGKGLERVRIAIRDFVEARRGRRKVRLWKRASARVRGVRGSVTGAAEQAARMRRRERRAHNRTLKTFMRFAKWGERQGVSFRTTRGPLEYACDVGAAAPESAAACREIAAMFEEVMYSQHDITEGFRSDLQEKVKRVTKSR